MRQKAPDPTPGTRERLLDTAERLFAARGFAGTSVREITDAAGANLGAVNYYFRSKENLYAEVFARRAALLREPIVAAARRGRRRRPQRARPGAFRALGRAFLAPHEDRDASLRLLGLFARETVEPCLPPAPARAGVPRADDRRDRGRRAAGAARSARGRRPGPAPTRSSRSSCTS